jgi:hypothetical protein
MSAITVEQAIENIYTSVNNDNEDFEVHFAALKSALAAKGKKEVEFDPARLTHGNREGRKLMQAYFRRGGLTVTFKK